MQGNLSPISSLFEMQTNYIPVSQLRVGDKIEIGGEFVRVKKIYADQKGTVKVFFRDGQSVQFKNGSEVRIQV